MEGEKRERSRTPRIGSSGACTTLANTDPKAAMGARANRAFSEEEEEWLGKQLELERSPRWRTSVLNLRSDDVRSARIIASSMVFF
jgi:hypothetical protein